MSGSIQISSASRDSPPPPPYDHRFGLGAWYYSWDCSSGCVWDPDAILDFKQGVKVQHTPGFVAPDVFWNPGFLAPPDGEADEEATAAAVSAALSLLGLDELPTSEACHPARAPLRSIPYARRPVGPTRTCALLLVAQAAIDEAFQAGAEALDEALGQNLLEGKLRPGDQRLVAEIFRSMFDACAVLNKAVAD